MPILQDFIRRCRDLLAHPLLGIPLALIAVALCAPSLKAGWFLDDHLHRAALTAPESLPESARSPVDLFAFAGEGWPQRADFFPWWAEDDLLLAFFRPVTGLSHGLDYWLWPDEPMWMHLHSLLWWGLCVLAAAVLFRRLAPSDAPWIGGLTLLLFAVDDSHALAASWIANRNALICLFFTVLTLIAYDLWRRDGRRSGAIAAPILLATAVLSAESGIVAGAFLLCYALFLDRGSLGERLKALVPCAIVGVVWLVGRASLGYGIAGHRLYLDPLRDPIRFAGAMWERGPILLMSQLAVPPADLYGFLSPLWAERLWWGTVVGILIYGLLMIPILKTRPIARFWAAALVLAVIPSCATVPTQRLLLLPSLAGAGVTAFWLFGAWKPPMELSKLRRYAARAISVPLVLVHFIQAPIGVTTAGTAMAGMTQFLGSAAESLPSGPEVSGRHVVVVNGPSFFMSSWAPVRQALDGRAVPQYVLSLAPSLYPVELHRPDAHTLVARSEIGFFPPPGTVPPGEEAEPFAVSYMFQIMDGVYHSGRAFRVGEVLRRGEAEIEISALTPDLRPAEIRCRFPTALEDEDRYWMRWQDGVFVPWQPPEIGATVQLAAPGFP